MLVSFDIVNMYPCIDNVRGIAAVTSFLNIQETKLPSTEYIIEGLNICLYHNHSIFAALNLLQTNGTATGVPNLWSYADICGLMPLHQLTMQFWVRKQNLLMI